MWRVQRFPNGGNFQYDSHGNQTEAIYSDSARNRTIDYSAADQAVQIRMGNAFAPSLRTRFWYGPDGSRYQREDNTPGASTKRTLYIGNLEIVSQGGITTTKRYVAGVLVQDLTSSGTTSQFLFHDHLGSVVRAVSASGVVLEGMDYGAFGERRGYTDPTLAALVPRTTARGFTGHEMIDGTDVVHMNGRIYDSALGRFLQADPIIQEPNNPQNFNRYSYVLNNPLSLTDPSGFLFGGIGKAFRRVLAGVLRNIPIPSENPFTRLLGSAALNLLANLIEPRAGGSSGVRGAFSNVAVSGFAQRPGDIGTAGGTAGSDGGFGHSFVQAGFFAGLASGPVTGDDVAAVTQIALAAGTDSAQSGGKFGNGAGSQTAARAGGLLSTGNAVADFGLGFIPGVSLVQALTDPSASALDVAFGALDLLPGGGRLFSLGARGIRSIAKLGRATKAAQVARGARVANERGVVREFVTETDQVFFRVFSEGRTGGFVTALRPRSSAFAQEALALPRLNRAEFIQEVLVPSGTRLRRSRAAPLRADDIFPNRRGGAEQFELLDRIPRDNFVSGVPFK